jgi:hypothetical protein
MPAGVPWDGSESPGPGVRNARGRRLGRAFLFLHPRGLAAQVAEERELGAPHLGSAHDIDPVDDRRMQREDALDALPNETFRTVKLARDPPRCMAITMPSNT